MASDTEQLWQQMHSGIRAFVGRRIRHAADVDDVVQRVFLRVHEGLSSLRDEERVHAWVYRTATHAIADYYRGPINRREIASGSLDDFAAAPGTGVGVGAASDVDGGDTDADINDDDQPARREFAGCVQPLLQSLSAADRETLTLIDVDEVSQVEAARRLGLSVSGMKSRIQRARRRFKTVVEDCCRVHLDRRGGIIGYEQRNACGCGSCAETSSASANVNTSGTGLDVSAPSRVRSRTLSERDR